MIKNCNNCKLDKHIELFYKDRAQCKDCMNYKRRLKYKENTEYRKKCIEKATIFKKKKLVEKRQMLINKIGIDNKLCKYCNIIKNKDKFRYNRCKCRDCERDDPKEKFKRYVRTRIYNSLKRNKNKRSVDYLGCSNIEYFNYIMSYNKKYTIENYGKIWHIDHIIPISIFDMENLEEQLLAFNWRNTMPLSKTENLRKNNKILIEQIRAHYYKLQLYHKNNNIIFEKRFIDLFAKHLDAGNSLESQTTTPKLETELEELG